ncbi:hypothetical protein ACFOMD_04295 [Sphingoaurantiacus capsulatus]|uniref:Glycine zipper domain-containing protein n=1 Tax=Sphingoaurantiacus capsulatus TaxID=1771310 RepID=A0ABV7X6Y4_9SPHN
MTRIGIGMAAMAAALVIASPAQAGDTKKVLKSGAIGAGAGAVAGAVIPGLSVGEGAIIGGVGGAVIGAVDKDRKYYRDNSGRRYYLDKRGNRVYR